MAQNPIVRSDYRSPSLSLGRKLRYGNEFQNLREAIYRSAKEFPIVATDWLLVPVAGGRDWLLTCTLPVS